MSFQLVNRVDIFEICLERKITRHRNERIDVYFNFSHEFLSEGKTSWNSKTFYVLSFYFLSINDASSRE